MPPASRIKTGCKRCGRGTNHAILAEQKRRGFDEASEIHWEETYQIIECLGCDAVSFRSEYGSSEDFDPNTGEPATYVELYPNRNTGREPMEGYETFPPKTRLVYRELLKTLNANAPVLSAIGLRALIESICIEQNVKAGNLKVGIDELAKLGLLSTKQAEFLHTHRFLGNNAAHEMVPPKPQELVAALDIAETLLKTIYVLPGIAATISIPNKPAQAQIPAPPASSTPAAAPPPAIAPQPPSPGSPNGPAQP